ncbi:unnamed protein product, partial [marine sediment metagenome]
MKGIKYTMEDVLALSSQMGFKFLSRSFQNVRDKCDWQCCKCGHQWEAAIYRIKDCKGCPRCTKRIYTKEDVMQLTQKKNITLLSKKYSNISGQYKWKCNKCNYKW